jgi:TPR repeat protein
MSLLRSAAGKASTKARIQLGALYATGQCVTQDNAAAYRWFAQAQELEPANSYVNRNMNLLWAKMSADERRRAEQ